VTRELVRRLPRWSAEAWCSASTSLARLAVRSCLCKSRELAANWFARRSGSRRRKGSLLGRGGEWHRRALCRAYARGEQGLPYESDLGDGFGYVSWNTCLRLRDYQVKGRERRLVRERRHNEPFGLIITDFGRQYYRENWQHYRQMYPEVVAPAPDDQTKESE
jgi:hypothetical protein